MRIHRRLAVPLLLLCAAAACQKASNVTPVGKDAGAGGSVGSGPGTGNGPGPGPVQPMAGKDIDSKDILQRSATSDRADVKHVLISWKELAPVYQGHLDPRAAERTNDQAAALAQEIAGKLRQNPDAIDALVKQYSEDPGSLSGEPYTVKTDSNFVPEFKAMALRLKDREVGIVRTQFGYHVMEKVLPPPPDPLESTAILARPPESGTVYVQHVLIGWKDVPAARQGKLDPRAANRAKADADKVAKEVFDKLAAGADMAALMKQYSEDPGSKDNGRSYDISPDAPMVEPFKNLALRLKVGEAGMVISPFGWHVIKRVPPPPPDSLESAEILARQPVTAKAKVKHVLLGWAEVNAGDPRGQKRTRAELEKLVAKTMADLKKGAKIEAVMKELSEDPGSAASGESYDVTPDAGLVQPFKDLSLRLNVGEVGAVKTQFGIHIIQRVE